MKKNGKNEELQSRREFFKRAAKGALPILAGAALLSSPILSETANAMSCAGCNNRCMNSCFNTLKSYIYNSVAELRNETSFSMDVRRHPSLRPLLCFLREKQSRNPHSYPNSHSDSYSNPHSRTYPFGC